MYVGDVAMRVQWWSDRWWRRVKISLACKVDKTSLEEFIKFIRIGIKMNR
jgi:hypothetical protein